jgi:hypothetical protein
MHVLSGKRHILADIRPVGYPDHLKSGYCTVYYQVKYIQPSRISGRIFYSMKRLNGRKIQQFVHL